MNGILIINKEIGYTSRDVVNIVSKILNTKKIGHTGTLDPMATGVLVLCVGQALKICELLTNHDKEYLAGVTLGISTDTLDMGGKIIKEEKVDVKNETISEVVKSFKKSYIQEVPKYSAVKINGKKLYEYARENINVELPKRYVNIKDISLFNSIVNDNGRVNFYIKCTVSKGTYIRSLVRDIGNKLNVSAVMNSLVRIKSGNFDIKNAYTIKDIEEGRYKFVDIYEALPNIPKIKVSDELAFKVKNGVILDHFFDTDMAFILDKEDNLLAIYENINGKAKVFKMFVM